MYTGGPFRRLVFSGTRVWLVAVARGGFTLYEATITKERLAALHDGQPGVPLEVSSKKLSTLQQLRTSLKDVKNTIARSLPNLRKRKADDDDGPTPKRQRLSDADHMRRNETFSCASETPLVDWNTTESLQSKPLISQRYASPVPCPASCEPEGRPLYGDVVLLQSIGNGEYQEVANQASVEFLPQLSAASAYTHFTSTWAETVITWMNGWFQA